MRMLILVAVLMGACYVATLRSIAKFITRDVPNYLEALKLTDADTRDPIMADLQVRREFLHRQTIEKLFEIVCDGPSDTTCFQHESEETYIRDEVAKLEYILKTDDKTPNNLLDTFIGKPGVVNRKELSDTYYKRILTDILLKRERSIEYLSSHKEQTREPKLRSTSARFADNENPWNLLVSFAIGAVLLVATQLVCNVNKSDVVGEERDTSTER